MPSHAKPCHDIATHDRNNLAFLSDSSIHGLSNTSSHPIQSHLSNVGGEMTTQIRGDSHIQSAKKGKGKRKKQKAKDTGNEWDTSKVIWMDWLINSLLSKPMRILSSPPLLSPLYPLLSHHTPKQTWIRSKAASKFINSSPPFSTNSCFSSPTPSVEPLRACDGLLCVLFLSCPVVLLFPFPLLPLFSRPLGFSSHTQSPSPVPFLTPVAFPIPDPLSILRSPFSAG